MESTTEKDTRDEWKHKVRDAQEILKQFIRQAYKDKTL